MYSEDSSDAGDSAIHDAMLSFVRRLTWLVPDPAAQQHTLEQLQIIIAEWEPLMAEGKKLRDPDLVTQFVALDEMVEMMRARVAVWFRRDQMHLLDSYADYRLAEVQLASARQLGSMEKEAKELQLPELSELVASRLGPNLDTNKLVGMTLERTESAEQTYEYWQKRMNTVWAGEWEPAFEECLPTMSTATLIRWFARLTKECEDVFQKFPQLRPPE